MTIKCVMACDMILVQSSWDEVINVVRRVLIVQSVDDLVMAV